MGLAFVRRTSLWATSLVARSDCLVGSRQTGWLFCLVPSYGLFASAVSFSLACVELMHDFVKGYVYCILGKYMYLEALGYLICDARTTLMVKHYKTNKPGSSQANTLVFQHYILFDREYEARQQ